MDSPISLYGKVAINVMLMKFDADNMLRNDFALP